MSPFQSGLQAKLQNLLGNDEPLAYHLQSWSWYPACVYGYTIIFYPGTRDKQSNYVQKWAKEEMTLKRKTDLETWGGATVVDHQSGEGAQHLLPDVT